MPKLTFLGTGTSTGVPQIGCTCPVCRSTDPHDKRLRTSALLETDDGVRLLIDCGPDFRQQMLSVPFLPLHAILLTHEHYDHVGGLDDIRPFCRFGQVDVYADELCSTHLMARMPYCFAENKYPGVPNIVLHTFNPGDVLQIGGIEVRPFQVFHGKMPIAAYRFGELVYITDMSRISPEVLAQLTGVKILVVNALRAKPHPTHQCFDEALSFVDALQPERAFFIHMSHDAGLHAVVDAQLPPHVHLAYDGLQITW